MCKVLYIAGYGRSGSTLLDILLGSHERAVSVGELVYLGEEWRHERRVCACGEEYDQCSFWGGAIQSEKDASELMRLSRWVDYRRDLPALLTDSVPDQVKQNYRNRTRQLFSYIGEQGRAEWIIDSSKSGRHAAGRFWALQNVAGLDVRVIHLTRDGRSVLRSVVEKGSNWAAEGYRDEKRWLGTQTTIGWVLANTIAWRLGRSLGSDRFHRVKFEDLLRAPEETLRQIGEFMGVDLGPVVQRILLDKPFEVGHNVGGNRIRHKQQIRLRRTDVPNPHPWSDLDRHHQILFATIGQWMNQKLGYSW